MRDVSENTVLATNQLPKNDRIYYLGNEKAPKRVLIVGNSITRHGVKQEIGWYHDHGMAASAPERDFVHLLQEKWREKGVDVLTMVSQCATWERGLNDPDILQSFTAERDFNADVVLFRLGENVSTQTDMAQFAKALRSFLAQIAPKNKLVLTTTVWRNEPLNEELRRAAAELGAPLCDLQAVGSEDALMAIGLFEHKGVAMHPGDKGMAYIADAVFPALLAAL